MRVLLVSDKSYLAHLDVLVASISKNSPSVEVHCYLINVSNRAEIEARYGSIYGDIRFSYIDLDFSTMEKKRAYCANCRMTIISSMLNSGSSPVLYLDVDSIVRSDLRVLVDDLGDSDCLLHHRPYTQDCRLIYASGVMLISSNAKTKSLFTLIASLLEDSIYEWYADQISLARGISENGSTIQIAQLDERYIDWNFKKNSVVWTGKGDRKYRNLMYAAEANLYKHRKYFGSQKLATFNVFLVDALVRPSAYIINKLIKPMVPIIRCARKISSHTSA